MTDGPSSRRTVIIGVDPGRSKCGLAVVYDDGSRKSLAVVPTPEIADRLDAEVRASDVRAICIGHATGSDSIVAVCASRWPNIPRRVVDETNTTLEARRLYYFDHPPRGLWRFVPRGLLVPDEPLDAYAALLIVSRFQAEKDLRDTDHPRAGKG
ncbi:MAG: resolvase [Candidatus Eremiobacterales bacterium]|jgi:RNase H-fold protein (predicted Holliday junction resolvase)